MRDDVHENRKYAAVNPWMLLFNPSSRNGTIITRRVREQLRRHGVAAQLDWVPLQALSAVDSIPARIIVIGGDGTINAAAEWLLRREHSCPLGIVPAGTGNNLARGLGLPLETGAAMRVAFAETVGPGGSFLRGIDGIAYQGGSGDGSSRVIVQTAALGYPAHVASRYDELRRRPLFRGLCRPVGPHVYRLLALLGLWAQKRREQGGESLLELECRLPGETLKETVFAIFIGNERSLGGNFYPCPQALLDDGKVDLCFVRAGTGKSYLKLFQQILKGTHLSLEETIVYRQTQGPVDLRLSAPSELLADGDLWLKDSQFHLEVLPGRFEVLTSGTGR